MKIDVEEWLKIISSSLGKDDALRAQWLAFGYLEGCISRGGMSHEQCIDHACEQAAYQQGQFRKLLAAGLMMVSGQNFTDTIDPELRKIGREMH